MSEHAPESFALGEKSVPNVSLRDSYARVIVEVAHIS